VVALVRNARDSTLVSAGAKKGTVPNEVVLIVALRPDAKAVSSKLVASLTSIEMSAPV
jgi:hypothetical protein